MGWNRATSFYNPPTVGYSNGRCQGFQVATGPDAAAYLNLCRSLFYRVDQSFSLVNRGNLAIAQKDNNNAAVMYGSPGGEAAILQDFPEKNAAAMYGPPGAAVLQDFSEKKANVMEDKLSLALQAIEN